MEIFVMGPNTWREEDDWPLPDTQFRPYYLHSAGRANTAAGNGALSTEAPGDEFEDAYLVSGWRSQVPTSRASIATSTREERFRRKRKKASSRRLTASITTVRTPTWSCPSSSETKFGTAGRQSTMLEQQMRTKRYI